MIKVELLNEIAVSQMSHCPSLLLQLACDGAFLRRERVPTGQRRVSIITFVLLRICNVLFRVRQGSSHQERLSVSMHPSGRRFPNQ